MRRAVTALLLSLGVACAAVENATIVLTDGTRVHCQEADQRAESWVCINDGQPTHIFPVYRVREVIGA